MEHIFARIVVIFIYGAARQEVVARPAVHDVAAEPSPELVCSAKTAHLVLAVLPSQRVCFVGTREQATVGAAGHVVSRINCALQVEGPRLCAPV